MLTDVGMELERLRARRAAAGSMDDAVHSGKLLSFYTRILTKVADCERCSVFIHDPAKKTVWLKAGTGLEESDIEIPREGSVAGRVIATGKPIIEAGLENKPGPHKDLEAKTGFVTRNIMCVPIKSPNRDEVTGAFQLLNKADKGTFDDNDLSLAQEAAEHLQTEVDRLFLNQEIFGLTGRLYSAARKSMIMLVASLASLFVVLLASLVVYVAAPTIFG